MGRSTQAPQVSVVINNYNYARYVGEAIESALAQSYARVEVIVVDDGSTDGSRAAIAAYAGRVQAIFQANGGQGAAFNTGFAASRGAVVLFLDADDRLRPDAVARVVAAWRPGLAKAQFRLRVIGEAGHATGATMPPACYALPSGDLRGAMAAHGFHVCPPTTGNAFARATLEALLPMPAEAWRISADAFLTTQAPFLGEVLSIEDTLGDYRLHGQNLWADGAAEPARLARLVDFEERKAALVQARAAAAGLAVPADLALRHPAGLFMRMALSARGEGPTSLAALARAGVRAIWRFPQYSPPRRVAMAAWCLALAVLPRPGARMLLDWQLFPRTRPAAVTRLLRAARGRRAA